MVPDGGRHTCALDGGMTKAGEGDGRRAATAREKTCVGGMGRYGSLPRLETRMGDSRGSGAAINDDDNVDVSADGGAVVRCRRRRRGGNNERGGAHFPWPCRIEYAGDANEKTEERGEEREGRAGNVQDPFSAVFRQ